MRSGRRGLKTPPAWMRVRWTAYIPRKMSPPTRPRSCCISIRWSGLTAVPAFRYARFRPSSRSTICRRSGTLSPSATPNTSGGNPAFGYRLFALGSGSEARVLVWARASLRCGCLAIRVRPLSLIRVSQDFRVFAGMRFHRVENADVFMLVHAHDVGLGHVALVIVDLKPVTLRFGQHENRTTDRRRKD